MPSTPLRSTGPFCLSLTDAVVAALRATATREELVALMKAVAREMGFRYYALAHHNDFGNRAPIVLTSEPIRRPSLIVLSVNTGTGATQSEEDGENGDRRDRATCLRSRGPRDVDAIFRKFWSRPRNRRCCTQQLPNSRRFARPASADGAS